MSATAKRITTEAAVVVVGCGVLFWSWRADTRWFEVHTSWCYCAELPHQIGMARVQRALGVVLGVALLVFVRGPMGRAVARQSLRESFGSVARLSMAVLLALLVGEWWLRRHPELPLLHFEAQSEPDDRLGWKPVPSRVTDVPVGDRVVQFVVDANGWRLPSHDAVVDVARPTVLSTGESLAAGFGVDSGDTYPALVEHQAKVQVVNLAVHFYAMDMAYQRLVDALPRFDRPVATVTMVVPLGIERMMWPDRPHLVPDDTGTLLFEPTVDPSPRPWRIAELFRRSIYHSDEAIRRTRAIVEATWHISNAHGAFPLFVLVSWPGCVRDATGVPSVEHTLFDGLAVSHIRVDLPADVWDPTTWHPGPRGHTMIAEAIVQFLRSRALVP